MTSKHIFVLLLFFSANSAISQFSEKPDYYHMIMPTDQRGKFTECQVYQYFPEHSRDTLLVRKWLLDDSGKILSDEIGNAKIKNAFAVDRSTVEADRRIVFEYDSLGNLISESTHNPDSTISSARYFYDSNGYLIKQEFWSYLRKLKPGVIHEKSGCIVEEVPDSLIEPNYSWYRSRNYKKFIYSETGLLLIIQDMLDSGLFLQNAWQFEYNEQGKVAQETRFYAYKDAVEYSLVWNYSERGFTVTKKDTGTKYYFELNQAKKVTIYWCETDGENVTGGYQYQYDPFGRLVREEYVDPITEDIIYRRIYRYR